MLLHLDHALNTQSAPTAPESENLVRQRAEQGSHETQKALIRDYYRVTVDDYLDWSRDYNMHFGYYRVSGNPFNRESMLHAMNQRVLDGLQTVAARNVRLVDLGCGVGATARDIASTRRNTRVDAVTISPDQVARAEQLNTRRNIADQVRMVEADYCATGLSNAHYDGAYAIESACHAPGADKLLLVREAARLLKSGTRFVIADAMLRNNKPLTGILGWAYRTWCRNWAVPELAQVKALKQALEASGFVNIEIEDVSLRVAASAAHVPWVATRFTLLQLIKHRGRLPAWRWRHIGASYLSLLLGAASHRVGYFIITAQRA